MSSLLATVIFVTKAQAQKSNKIMKILDSRCAKKLCLYIIFSLKGLGQKAVLK